MITFGFKNKTFSLIRVLIAIVLGVIMVAKPASSLVLLVKIVAAFLIASGIVSLVYGIIQNKREGLPLMIVNACVDVILGIILFLFPEAVAGILIILIGILLLCVGVFQIIALASASAGIFMYILPVLCTAGGALLLFNPFGSAEILTLVAGIAVIIYGVSEFAAMWKMNKAMKAYEEKMKEAQDEASDDAADDSDSSDISDKTQVKDVDYEKVDEQ